MRDGTARLANGRTRRALRSITVFLIALLLAGGAYGQTAAQPPAADVTGVSATGPGAKSDAEAREAAITRYVSGDLAGAATGLAGWLGTHPDDSQVAGMLAQTLWLMGDAASATSMYEDVLAERGDDPSLLYQLALVRRAEGDYAGSLECLESVVERLPEALEFRVEFARTLGLAGRYERAAAEWRSVISVVSPDDPILPGCYYGLGLAELGSGDSEAAVRAFREGALLCPGDPAFAKQLEALDAPGTGS